MILLKNHTLHPDFLLDGNAFLGINDLLIYCKKKDITSYNFLLDWFNNETFIQVKTSGSTGKPKTIRLAKKAMIASALATGNYFDLPSKTTAFLCLSSNYIAGKMMFVRAMVLGWHLDILSTSSKPLINNTKPYDFGAMVPLQVSHSLNGLKYVKKLIIGGGAISSNLLNELYLLKTKCFATYGMTETITHIAVKALTKNNSNYSILPNINISQDNRNCLVIKAPLLNENDIVTNDIVKIHSTTEFEWLGRYDSIINSGGIKILPEQVEAKLATVIKTRFFISSLPDELLENKVVLIVEGKENSIDLASLKPFLTKYEMPKAIYYTPKFVVTDTKKIQRQKTLDLIIIK